MLQLIFSLSLVIILSGCGDLNRANARVAGYTEVCVGNVIYLQFVSGVTPAYEPNGKLVTCNQ